LSKEVNGMQSGTVLRAEDYQRRRDRYCCEVENVSTGGRLARGEGASREKAEAEALNKARETLARTRVYPPR
jgi:dsRNA-specific ribonuclease